MTLVHNLLSRFAPGSSDRGRPDAAGSLVEPQPSGPRPRLNIRFFTDFPTCNLSCSYCIAGHGTTFAKPQNNWDEDRFNQIIHNIGNLPYDVNMRIGVSGEFFVSKVLMDGARMLSNKDNISSLNLITNLTLSIRQYESVFRGYKEEKLAVVASFHPEQIADHEAWFQKAAEFSRRYDFAVVMVAFPSLLEEIAAYKARLNDLGVTVFIQPFRGPHEERYYPQGYSEEQRVALKSMMYSRHDYEYLLNLKKPGMCNAGHQSIFVDAFGKVRPCGVGPYKSDLGDLSLSPDLALRTSPAPCPFRACQCDTENVNTLEFHGHYEPEGKNQHRYRYRFTELAEFDGRYDEWSVNY